MLRKKTKRSLQVSIVKTPDNETDDPAKDKILHTETAKLITERSKELVKYVALTVVAAYVVAVAADTARQIAVKKTKSADKED